MHCFSAAFCRRWRYMRDRGDICWRMYRLLSARWGVSVLFLWRLAYTLLTLYKNMCVCVSVGMVHLCLVWLVMAFMCLYALFLLRVRFHCWCDAVE